MTLDDYYLDVKDYGAVANYNTSTGAGTDDTTAINDALYSTRPGAANAGKIVLLTRGEYKIAGTVQMVQGSHLAAVNPVKGAGAGWNANLNFTGGPTAHCVAAIGGSGGMSRVRLTNLYIRDRRVGATAGDGIHLSNVVNQTDILGCEVHWTNGVGRCVYVGAPSGVSDCVTIDDLWVNGGLYGIQTERIDNHLIIRAIRGDTQNGSGRLALIRVNGYCPMHITGVKHENLSASTVTVEAVVEPGTGRYVTVEDVISRVGNGGAVVQINGGNGTGVQLRGITRAANGTLLKHVNGSPGIPSITGTALPSWQAGREAPYMGTTTFLGVARASNYTAVPSELVLASTATAAITITMPTAPDDKTMVAVKHAAQAAGRVLTIAGGGAKFELSSGPTTLTLPLVKQGVLLQYSAPYNLWFVVCRDSGGESTTTPSGAAINSEVVHLTGNETVAGIKTFSSSPIVPTPTTSGQAAPKAYVDAAAAAPIAAVTAVSGATYTLTLADTGTIVETSSASAVTVTVPPNSTAAFPVGVMVMLRQYGTGQVTVAPGAGVAIRSRGGAYKTAGQYAEAALTKRGTNEWVMTGDTLP